MKAKNVVAFLGSTAIMIVLAFLAYTGYKAWIGDALAAKFLMDLLKAVAVALVIVSVFVVWVLIYTGLGGD